MYSKYPKNIAYKNTGQDRDYNIYTEEFLGGADTYIYINGELFNDISAIQYTVNEQQKPIYGYASRLYDDVASGIRIVQGAIKVPVRNTKHNESLTFVSDTEKNSRIVSSDIPNWVYKYTPENSSEDNGEVSRSSSIYDVQNKLISLGYNVNPTGVLDSKTKIAILKHKKKIGKNINLKNFDSILEDGK